MRTSEQERQAQRKATRGTFSLHGKVAIVTGAGQGLGKHMALALAEAGADVAIAARTTSSIEQTAHEITRLGRKGLAIRTDVTVPEQFKRLVDMAIAELGKVDILINNAGQNERPVPIWDIRDEQLRSELAIDLLSHFYGVRAVAKHMYERRRGKIIGIGSSAYWIRGGRHAYIHCMAEGGVFGLTRALAITFAPFNIQVNCIGPGLLPTDPARNVAGVDDTRLAAVDYIPMQRTGSQAEFAPLAVFLSSEASDYITGQYFCVDGGVIAGGYASTGYSPVIGLE